MSGFRERVLDALDDWYEETDGDTPQHIIVSESKYAALSVEQLKRGGDEYYIDSGEGYIGMVLWKSAALDEKEVEALFLTDEMMRSLFTQAKDL